MEISSIGILGFGAFGQLIVRMLSPHFKLCVYDKNGPLPDALCIQGENRCDIKTVATCDVVILSVPCEQLEVALRTIRPFLKPGAIVCDVCSVKVEPARLMKDILPAYVDIVGTHPLFGPQSAKSGVKGHKIAVCPIRCNEMGRIAAFIRKKLGLKVFFVTPEEHDAETAISQGLTHLVARIITEMQPYPERLTTKSFDLLRNAVELVRYDSDSVFMAIQRTNPYASLARKRFLELATMVDEQIGDDGQALFPAHLCRSEERKNRIEIDCRRLGISRHDCGTL